METDGRQYQAINRAALTECEARLEARDREIEELRQRAQRAEAEKQEYEEAAERWHDAWAKQHTQRQNAEAECERLRRSLQNVMVHTGHTKTSPDRLHMELLDHIAQIVSNALATPPPEGGSESWAGTWDEQADVPLCDWKPGMRNTPEQADSYPLDSEGRCLKCGGTGRIGVDSTREPCPACNSLPPQQAHGDALAALDRILLRGDNAKCGDFQIVRNALTASGVPEGYKLVPMEPTPKMVDATWDHDEDETESHDTRNHRIWSAMIAAAPTDGRE